jgi:Xaa-Pro aminopeptidase
VLLHDVRGGVGESTRLLPAHSPEWERWNGPRAHPSAEARARTGIADIRALEALPELLEARVAAAARLLYLPTANPRAGQASPDERWEEALRARHPELDFADLRPLLHPLRQVKGPGEVERLRRAIAITGAALRDGFAIARPGRHEFEVEAAIEAAFRAHGGEGPGFDSIVGSGPNSCVLHHQRNDRRIEAGDLIVIDVGAAWGGYTADITRTIPVTGRFTPRQREIYEVVARAQRAGIAAARPGATLADVNRAARAVVAEAGLVSGFLHGTSHHVGLEVHDVGPDRPLAPGMVITVEPGVYLVGEELGVRIEDMILITAHGREVLSTAIPKEAAALEVLIAELRGVIRM